MYVSTARRLTVRVLGVAALALACACQPVAVAGSPRPSTPPAPTEVAAAPAADQSVDGDAPIGQAAAPAVTGSPNTTLVTVQEPRQAPRPVVGSPRASDPAGRPLDPPATPPVPAPPPVAPGKPDPKSANQPDAIPPPKVSTATSKVEREEPFPGSIFDSCDHARAAGMAPLYRGQPGYSERLDKDGDGIACDETT